VIVRIVNIGEIVDHHFLGFHFIIIDDFLQAWDNCFLLFFRSFLLACTFSIYGFWLPLEYLQNLHVN
jgi:hypothetical protein